MFIPHFIGVGTMEKAMNELLLVQIISRFQNNFYGVQHHVHINVKGQVINHLLLPIGPNGNLQPSKVVNDVE